MSEKAKQCFTPVPARRVWVPGVPSVVSLCPSMDLMMLGLPSAGLWLHRTVSSQRLATLAKNVQQACWSPDGRLLAVIEEDQKLSLYQIEDLIKTGESYTSLSSPDVVTAMTWAHVGKNHPAWQLSEDEQELDFYCMLRSDAKADDEAITPLSLLCVATPQQLNLYLHGQYALHPLPVQPSTNAGRVNLQVSNNLTHVMLLQSDNVTIYSLPQLVRDRFALQTLTAVSCTIAKHLTDIETGTTEVLAAYKSSLKPLDLKMDQLAKLLVKYDYHGSMADYIVQYVLQARSPQAMEQFFSGVQMNDQLLVRMERSLTVAVANVEAQFRQRVVRPAQALVYQAGELYGLLDNATLVQAYQEQSLRLYTAVESLLSALVDARFRLRDLCAWLRSAGSQIKAQGTDSDSVQRENAKKRQAPDDVVHRILQYLQSKDEENACGSTETILGLHVAHDFGDHGTHGLDSLVGATRKAFDNLTQGPRDRMKEGICWTKLRFASTVRAMTLRVGAGGVDEECDGLFVLKDGTGDPLEHREWMVVAEESRQTTSSCVQLHAVPLTWTEHEPLPGEVHGVAGDSFWTTLLRLPDGYFVHDLAFYGDDGKSSLLSGTDSGTGKERSQALGMLVSRQEHESSSKLELWLCQYDSVLFHRTTLRPGVDGSMELRAALSDSASAQKQVVPMPESFDPSEDEMPEGVLFAKTRSLESVGSSRLLVSGSRGIGAVVVNHMGTTSVDLFDLEEDEEEEEEEEEEADDDELADDADAMSTDE